MKAKPLSALWLVPAVAMESHQHVHPKQHRIVEHHRVAFIAMGWQCEYLMTVVLN